MLTEGNENHSMLLSFISAGCHSLPQLRILGIHWAIEVASDRLPKSYQTDIYVDTPCRSSKQYVGDLRALTYESVDSIKDLVYQMLRRLLRGRPRSPSGTRSSARSATSHQISCPVQMLVYVCLACCNFIDTYISAMLGSDIKADISGMPPPPLPKEFAISRSLGLLIRLFIKSGLLIRF